MPIHASFDCGKANKMDLVEWLHELGYHPTKIRGQDHWYLSPLRDEKTPSFKVNRTKNVWFDHGLGKGGTVVDFGILYYNCTVKDLLERLSAGSMANLFFHPPFPLKKEADVKEKNPIKILKESVLTHPELLTYLDKRSIPHDIAQTYCSQVEFELNKRRHMAIAFKNSHGGYELRNGYFKGSSSPKQPRLILQEASPLQELIVFEGFFSFLSYQTLQRDQSANMPKIHGDFLVLNSAAFFERSRQSMERYDLVHLFLDRDTTGKNLTARALGWSSKYIDQSTVYQDHKDLNETLSDRHSAELQKKKRSRGMRL